MTLLNRLNFGFVVFIALISIKLWSFRVIPDKVYDGLELLAVFVLVVIVISNLNKIRDNRSLIFKTNVLLLIFIPLISAVAAYFFHDQSLVLSLLILRTNFFWLLYLVLHIFDIPVKKVIRLMVIIGVVWAVITAVQQFTYPRYLFYVRSDEDPYEFFRDGIYRYMIAQHQYCLFMMVFLYNRFLKQKNLIDVLFVIVGLVGFYYYGTRLVFVASILVLIIASLSQNNNAKVFSILTLALSLIGIVYFKDILFARSIEMTTEQIKDSRHDVRTYAAMFYLFEYWPHWITVFTGNGFENIKSPYGQELLYLNKVHSLYRSDVGPIGTLNTFGVFYLINIIWMNIKGLKNKYYSVENRYYKLLFINAFIVFLITDSYAVPSGAVPFFCFVLYLVDQSYKREV